MKGSPNNSKDMEENSTYSNSSYINHNNSSDQPTGITSILSPRNIMKFFTKNIQEIASPRLSFIANTAQQVRVCSKFTIDQINKQFSKYTDATRHEMEKYKINQLKKIHNRDNKYNKQQERQQLQQEVKISRIHKHYFQQWKEITKEDSISKSQLKQSEQKQESNQEKEVHKSMKLHTLLVQTTGDHTRQKKKSKQKRRPLYQKQIELEGYLDEIQLVIFNKTRKYPDRYLHYLANIDKSDMKINCLLTTVSNIRVVLGQQVINVKQKHLKVIALQKKKKNLSQLVSLMSIMNNLFKFKKQSENNQAKKSLQNQKKENSQNNEINNFKSTQLIKFIHQHPQRDIIFKIFSISQTLNNASELVQKIKSKKLQKICKELHKGLSNKLSNMYSRDSWLKSQLPKDALMIQKMKPEIQKLAKNQSQQQGNLNNSYLNTSVLDQSYCVGSNMSSKKQQGIFNFGNASRQAKELIQDWNSYSQQYKSKNQQEQEQIYQIFQRVLLKFTVTFNRDLEDYIAFIYGQNFSNLKAFNTHKERLTYIQSKLFNKIVKLYFQALSSSFTYALIFKDLSSVYSKLLKLIQQKITEMIQTKSLTDYSLVQNQIISYDDVVQVVNSLDFWCQYASEVGDKYQRYQQQGCNVSERMLQFQQTIVNQKCKIIGQYLANLHKFALISDLKSSIEKSDFNIISIPVYSFSILDFIINWGQKTDQNTNSVKINQVEQSFCFGSSFLIDLQNQKKQIKKNNKFSIFKVIDKRLIIQGKQYKLCDSSVILLMYLGIYLKAKVDFPNSSPSIDERICELIGFYIWYCKKLIFTVTQHHQASIHTVQHGKSVSIGPKTTQIITINKKTINNLCMLINLCDFLGKIMDIVNITSKQKKVDKILTDLQTIKADSFKQITMVPFMQVQQYISNLYESRLKTRKQIPTKQTLSIIQTIQKCRNSLSLYFQKSYIKKGLENTVKMVSKNYFGYLMNMEHRGKAQLKCFLPKFKDAIGDIFPDETVALEKQLRF